MTTEYFLPTDASFKLNRVIFYFQAKSIRKYLVSFHTVLTQMSRFVIAEVRVVLIIHGLYIF